MDMLQAGWDDGKFVCVGLDSDYDKLPRWSRTSAVSGSVIAFNHAITGATGDLALAYKPNLAFYEKYWVAGLQALELSIKNIKRVAPDVPIIIDYKRGDIGNTNEGYVIEAVQHLGADAVTVPPYMGRESLQPFLENEDMGVLVLCKTSNPGSGEFQDLAVQPTPELVELFSDDELGEITTVPLYQRVAANVANEWNISGNCGLVVGATYPDDLAGVRKIVRDMPILIPGIGAQEGDLEATVKAGADSNGQGMVINNSRGVIFASGEDDFDVVARKRVVEMTANINAALAA